ncbi:hypothetical protein Tco_1197902 [Tanacetum coccineum]
MVLHLCPEQEQTLDFIPWRYSCNSDIGSNNLLWKVITRLQVISEVEGAEPDINYSQVAIKGSCCDTHELVEYIKQRTKFRALNENDIGGEVNEKNPNAALKCEMVDG